MTKASLFLNEIRLESTEYRPPEDRDVEGNRVKSLNCLEYVANNRLVIPQQLTHVLLI